MFVEILNSDDALTELRAAGVTAGTLLGLAVGGPSTAGFATADIAFAVNSDDVAALIARVDHDLRPRWAVWSNATASALITGGTRLATCWDVAAVHRLLAGVWRADAPRVWASMRGIDEDAAPALGQLDLLGVGTDDGGDPDRPDQPDGYLRPEWVAGGWSQSARRLAAWALAALQVATWQAQQVAAVASTGDAEATARSESAAELLCAELAADGLPIDRAVAESLLQSLIGERPANEAAAQVQRVERDQLVLHHLPPGSGIDLRSPADVKSMLRRLGIDVPDTRARRLEELRDPPQIVAALLQWRKAERVATTFGYGWLDANVGDDDRLRGDWSGSDGAAGRMTAGAGLHNLPAELRPMVVAAPGHVFVRGDLGQIEPRVLAVVSGDESLRTAALDDDLYAPVAKRLSVDRAIAKVAVLAAMYGQTSGTAGQALRGMESAFPVAIKYLADAAQAGVDGRDLRTFGGRLVRMWPIRDDADYRAVSAARGRYARNAMVQGAAAELFKVWAVTVRARGTGIDARIVLCLHDELLLHVPEANADAAVSLLHDCLAEAAHRWQRGAGVRFIADVSVVHSWADAKG
ncbi:bifunctional 3'-5' exonuclease/DNA polymerase [soil metagenome]